LTPREEYATKAAALTAKFDGKFPATCVELYCQDIGASNFLSGHEIDHDLLRGFPDVVLDNPKGVMQEEKTQCGQTGSLSHHPSDLPSRLDQLASRM
jgi:hypothetical protein